MKKLIVTLLVSFMSMMSLSAAWAEEVVGVSWSNFGEARWKSDEDAMKKVLKLMGAKYISADAGASSSKQVADIQSLIDQGATSLIIVAEDASALDPAIAKANEAGVPMLGYDRLIEDESVYYLTFDNKEVGRMQAREILKVKPEGNFVFIKGSPSDPNSDFLFEGQIEVLQEAIDAGKIKNVGESYTDGWKPSVAETNMAAILAQNNNQVDAVIASNDGTAGGVINALAAQGLVAAVSGQDGSPDALNRVAKGTQTVSVWKDARKLGAKAAELAVLLSRGKEMKDLPGTVMFDGGAKGVTMYSNFLKPVALTQKNLRGVISAGWVTKETVCEGVEAGTVSACK